MFWHQECQLFMGENPVKVITQYSFMTLLSKAWYRAMTIPNAMATFKTTGVYPFNRHAIKLTDSEPQVDRSLCEKSGLAFILLYSLARQSRSKPMEQRLPDCDFTSEEVARFVRRYEEGYNITTDERYNCWLRQHEQSTNPSLQHWHLRILHPNLWDQIFCWGIVLNKSPF